MPTRILVLVPSVFLGSAAAYVWKTKIREILARSGAPANGLSKGGNLGTPTARPEPGTVSSRRNRNEDVESGVNPSG